MRYATRRLFPLSLLILLACTIGASCQGCQANKMNAAAAVSQKDTVAPVLREFEQQHPELKPAIEADLANYDPSQGVGAERSFKDQVTPYLQQFARENPTRQQRIDDMLSTWEMRLQSFEK